MAYCDSNLRASFLYYYIFQTLIQVFVDISTHGNSRRKDPLSMTYPVSRGTCAHLLE
jgi:hypothetical protein